MILAANLIPGQVFRLEPDGKPWRYIGNGYYTWSKAGGPYCINPERQVYPTGKVFRTHKEPPEPHKTWKS